MRKTRRCAYLAENARFYAAFGFCSRRLYLCFRLYVETYLHKGVNITHRVSMCAGMVSMCANCLPPY